MKRILADLPDADVKRLDDIAKARGTSRASLLREAVSAYTEQPAHDSMDWIERGFGLWKRRGMAFDAKDYERRRRAEWTRPWDDDYEEVRAESPDLFDEEDDRQRKIYLDMIAGNYPSPKSPRAS